jgi:tetratricopeptide (TPR) repeat protein
MKKFLWTLSALVLASFCTIDVNAQIQTPAPSPFSKLMQTVGLTEVTIEYSRPGVKDRTIFGKDGLVPYGKPWRLGANAATKFTFDKNVKIADAKINKGAYAVLAKPGKDEWSFMFYEYEDGSWSSYLEKEAVATVTAKPEKSVHSVETMTFTIDELTASGALISLHWADISVSMPLSVDTDAEVEASIKKVMNGPTGDDYYRAASYYHDMGKNLKQAKAWIEKATEGDNPKFWQVRRKALIYKDMGMVSDAIEAAKQSMELAQKAGNEDYVRMNKKSIAEWSKKK